MKYKVEKKKGQVVLEVTISKEEWEKDLEEAYKNHASKFNVEGFRKGKAPRRVIEQMYGKGVFFEDAINGGFYKYYVEILNAEKDIEPIDMPSVDVKSIDDKGTVLIATVEVRPEVKMGQYKGLGISEKAKNVTAANVNEEVKKEQQKHARLIEVQEPLENGYIANIDFEGYVEDKKFDGGTSEGYDLELGSHSFIDTFEDQLIGLKAGDKKDVKVSFPSNYQAKELAGKPAVFKVKINYVKKKELPELDDKFAADVSSFETMAEFKDDIKKSLQSKAEKTARANTENAIIEKIISNMSVEVPNAIIEQETDAIIRDMENRLMYQGLKFDDYLSYIQMSMEEFRKNKKAEAVKSAKVRMAMQEIIRLEKMDVTKEEINDKIKELAKIAKKPLKEFKESVTEQRINYIQNDILLNKLINFLVENNK